MYMLFLCTEFIGKRFQAMEVIINVRSHRVATRHWNSIIKLWQHSTQYFRLFHVCAIYSLSIMLLVNTIYIRNFRRFWWNDNFLTTKITRITV